MAYRIFITDTLRNIAKSTASMSSGGEYPAKRFIELIDYDSAPEDSRTQEEIIDHIRTKLQGLSET